MQQEHMQSSILVTSSKSSSSTNAGSGGFSRLDIAAARVLVKRLVRSGLRKGPSDMLLLSDSALDSWYDDDAVAYMHEVSAKKMADRGVIKVG